MVNATVPTMDDVKTELIGESALLLVGSIAFVMVLFYLVNSHVKTIVSHTWSMINLSVSIFSAVVSYNVVSKLIELGLETVDGSPGRILSRFLQLFGWWILVAGLLFCARDSPLHLLSHGTIGGHILGFAAIYLFGDICLSEFFKTSPWMVLLVIPIAWVTIVLLFSTTIICRTAIKDDEDGGIDAWHDQSKDTGTDFLSMATAFLIVFFFRWLLIDPDGPPTIDGELGLAPSKGIYLLLLSTLFLFLSAIVAAAHHHIPAFFMDFISTTVATSAAFLLIFGYMWRVGETGSELFSQFKVAMLISIYAVAFLLLVVLFKTHCMRENLKGGLGGAFDPIWTGIGLAVGLSWEKVFDASMDGFSDYVSKQEGGNEKGAKIIEILFMVVVILVVVPAWQVYILPKADDGLQKKMSNALSQGSLPLRAFCCDEDLYDDYDGIEDDEEEEE